MSKLKGATSWQWTPADFGPQRNPPQEKHIAQTQTATSPIQCPLMRSSSSREPSPRTRSGSFGLGFFGTLRRSFRENSPFQKGILSRLPGTPRLSRSRKAVVTNKGGGAQLRESPATVSGGSNAVRMMEEQVGVLSPETERRTKSKFSRAPIPKEFRDAKKVGQVQEPSFYQQWPEYFNEDRMMPPSPRSLRPVRKRRVLTAASPLSMHPWLAPGDCQLTPGEVRKRQNSIQSPPSPTPLLLPSHPNDPYVETLDLSGEEQLDAPPSAAEAMDDLYSRLQSLLTPSPSPAITRRRRQLHPSAGPKNGSSEVGRPVRTSQESLMSLMSTSGYAGHTPSPLSPRALRRNNNPRSISSGSSRGSFGDIFRKQPPVVRGGSCRSFPQFIGGNMNGANHCGISKRSSVMSGSSCSTAAACSTSLPAELTIRPLFDLETCNSELDSPFIGREWLFRDIHESLLRRGTSPEASGQGLIIHGHGGTGKSMIMKELVRLSPFHTSCIDRNHSIMDNSRNNRSETRGSLDSGIASGSRISLNLSHHQQAHSPQSQPPNWGKTVASRIVGYHFCRIDSSTTCSVAEFLCHIGAQLALSPQLMSYAEYLASQPEIQSLLTLSNCLRKDPTEVFMKAIAGPLNSIKTPEGGPLLLLIDALDEAEFHRPEISDSLASFLVKKARHLPPWLGCVLSVRSEKVGVVEGVGWRRVSLDDVVLDQRVWVDCRTYVDYRLQSQHLREQAYVTTGLPENVDPLSNFAEHLVSVGEGNMLYLRYTLDLLEQGHIRLRTANYGALPLTLHEVFLLMFNLKFPSQMSFERVVPVLSILLASLQSLTARELFQIMNAGKIDDQLSWEDFCDRLLRLGEFLIQRPDDTYALFHPALREWLQKQSGHNNKFLADLRQGHILLALWLSRKGSLDPDEMLELGHHLLKSHPYKHLKTAPMSRTHSSSAELPLSSFQKLPLTTSNGPQNQKSSNGIQPGINLLPQVTIANGKDNHVMVANGFLDSGGASGRECQIMWIQNSAKNLLTSLASEKNMASPNTKVSRLLLLSGASADAKLPDGTPLLCRAAEGGQADLCALLLEFNANLNAEEPKTDRTPLILAATAGHIDVIQLLHQHKANLSQMDSSNKCAMVYAGENGHVGVVSFFLQCDWSSSLNPSSSSSTMPSDGRVDKRLKAVKRTFVRAAAAGQTKVCEFLLEMAEVNLEDLDPFTGETALCAACSCAKAETARYLMSCGAKTEKGKIAVPSAVLSSAVPDTASMPSTSYCRPTEPQPTTKHDNSLLEEESPLLCAVSGGSWEIVSGLLGKGLDADGAGEGVTPLMGAAKHGHIGVMELLLSRGASVDRQESKGRTALSYACGYDRGPCVALLLDRGASPNTSDNKGTTPLHYAARYAAKRVIQLLLERGAKLEEMDRQGYRPLDLAVKYHNLPALHAFLRKGAKLGNGTWILAKDHIDVNLILLQKLYDDANLLYRRGRIKDSATRYSYALKKFPQQLLKSTSAINTIEMRAVDLYYTLQIGLGRCHRRVGDFKESLDLCDEALQTVKLFDDADKGFEAYFLRARCKFDLKEMSLARQDAETAVRLCPSSVEARQLLQSLTLSPSAATNAPIQSGVTSEANGKNSAETRQDPIERTVQSPNCSKSPITDSSEISVTTVAAVTSNSNSPELHTSGNSSNSYSSCLQTPPKKVSSKYAASKIVTEFDLARNFASKSIIQIPDPAILPPGSGSGSDPAHSPPQKSASPAECSSDSGNQADFEDASALSPSRSRRSLETEL